MITTGTSAEANSCSGGTNAGEACDDINDCPDQGGGTSCDANPTGFDLNNLADDLPNEWDIAASDALGAIFTVPGLEILGTYLTPPVGSGVPLEDQVSFRFYNYDATFYGTSLMPGTLIADTTALGICNGGTEDGLPCKEDADCPPDGTCDPTAFGPGHREAARADAHRVGAAIVAALANPLAPEEA